MGFNSAFKGLKHGD